MTLPAVATLLVIVVLLGPGQPRPIAGARLFGVVAPDGTIRSLRVVVVARTDGRESPLGERELAIALDGGPPLRARTSQAGVADTTLDPAAHVGSRVKITDGDGHILTDAALGGAEPAAASDPSAFIEGKTMGELQVVARYARGPAVPPFETTLEIYAGAGLDEGGSLHSERALEGTATVEVRGGEPARSEIALSAKGPATITLSPIAEPFEIDIEAVASTGAKGRLVATVPLVMGGFHVAETSAGAAERPVEIVSPSPRSAAFVSFFSGPSRIGGATVPLEATRDGFFRGAVTPPDGADRMLVASDASERGQSTVVWPLGTARGLVGAPASTELAEGLSGATLTERARLRKVRFATVAMLAVAALAEIVLLLVVGRVKKLVREETTIPDNASAPEDDSPSDAAASASAKPSPMLLIAKNTGSTLLVALVTALLLLVAFASIAGLAVLKD